jgi:rSAM/selenodomain-associated transferase 1
MENLIIVFAKNPELGKCKTRLAKTIGNEKALSVYKQLIQHTATTVSQVNSNRVVFYSEQIQHNDFWPEDKFEKQVQTKGHLGQKMQTAFEWGFNQGYSKICIVGSDLLELKATDIDEAFLKLERNDLVFGPATDGGYYLMGMNELYKNAFKDKAWSTDQVLKQTLEDLKEQKVALLNPKTDIDTSEDLAKHPELRHFIPKEILKKLI